MAPNQTLLYWLLATLYLLSALCWVACAWLFREERPAIYHWSTGLVLAGLGFALIAVRDESRTWLSYVWADACFVVAIALFSRGIERFIRVRPSDWIYGAVVTLATIALVAAGPGSERATWRVFATFGAAIPIFGVTLVRIIRPVLAESGLPSLLFVATPILLVLVPFAARISQQALNPAQVIEMHDESLGNRALLFSFFVSLILFNFICTILVASRLLRSQRELVRRDALTQLPNRVALQEVLEREWAQMRRDGKAFALLALDLDRFKRINDAHGHLAGDLVLQESARRFLSIARRSDLVARTGGEEFLMVIPSASWDGALIAAERLRDAVAQTPFTVARTTVSITLSVGVTLVHADDEDVEAVLQRADQALYRAKAEGRDRVVRLERGGADWALVV